jgi:hypothetical protein
MKQGSWIKLSVGCAIALGAAGCGEEGLGPAEGPPALLTCDDGVDLPFGQKVNGTLKRGERDGFRFSGKKGQVVVIDVEAQRLADHDYDPNTIDTYLSLHGANGYQIAENDDAVGVSTLDSRLYTILPEDGNYCARVAECWSRNANGNCLGTATKTNTNYDIGLWSLPDPAFGPVAVDAEKGDDAASATALPFEKGATGQYVEGSLWGTFRDASDVDTFSFKLPDDVPTGPGDKPFLGVMFTVMPSGVFGDGSTAKTGAVGVLDAAKAGARQVEADEEARPLMLAMADPGQEGVLSVARSSSSGTPGANEFYFLRYRTFWGGRMEAEVPGSGTNDTPTTAEKTPFTADLRADFGGIITKAPADVDHYLITVPPTAKFMTAYCFSQAYGGGLRGLVVNVLQKDGKNLTPEQSSLETATTPAYADSVPVTGLQEVVVQVKAVAQAPEITSSHYVCEVYLAK